jgi:hypothetical protein
VSFNNIGFHPPFPPIRDNKATFGLLVLCGSTDFRNFLDDNLGFMVLVSMLGVELGLD